MARVRYLERADLSPEHQPLYDEIAASRGGLPPNFKALHSPVASARMAALGAADAALDSSPRRDMMVTVMDRMVADHRRAA